MSMGGVIKNKARLVEEGYSQKEGINYEDTIALTVTLDSIRMLFAFACYHNFTLHQIDVKSAFLNGYLMEEVYVKQPLGFENPKEINRVYKLNKALYVLKQVPMAWYERLSKFFISHGFSIGKIDNTLFARG